jgi:acetyl esterase/lipase
MKKLILISLIIFIANLSFSQEQDTTVHLLVDYPKDYAADLNTIYTKVDGWEGKMDIYFPKQKKEKVPVVINIHGGAWVKGVKESQRGFSSFFKEGYAVANVEYRLAATAKAPAAIEDIRCALIFLIKNAEKYNIDKNRIVIMGGSAGGHLALMGGMLGNNHLFDKNCKGVENVKVAAIIDKYGITSVAGFAAKSKSGKEWLGDKTYDEKYVSSLSPINYVNSANPPVFIVHGNADPTVPYQQSVDLYEKLLAAGVKCKFITVEGGLHGKFPKEKNSEVNQAIMDFLRETGITPK